VDGDVLQALVVTSFPLLVLWRGFRSPDRAAIERWHRRFGGPVDGSSPPEVLAHIRRGRRYRAVGASIGLVVAALPAYANLIDPAWVSTLTTPVQTMAWVIGGAGGAAVAEITLVQRPVGRRRARLERRTWRDYLPAWPVGVVAAAAVAAAVASVAVLLGAGDEPDDAVQLAMAGAAAPVAAGLLWWGLRRITDRPELSPDPPLFDLDRAMRADGAHLLAGATVAMAGTGALAPIGAIAATASGWLSFALGLSGWFAINAWWVLSRDAGWAGRAAAPSGAVASTT
jgi:hypothetical protein